MSKRSVPNRAASTSGRSVSRRSAFMPWVSDARRPKPKRRIVVNPAVTIRRGRGRVSTESGDRLVPMTMATVSSSIAASAWSRKSRSK